MSDIGIIGLAVMGQNLALNLLEKGFSLSIYNRTVSKVDVMVENAKKQLKEYHLKPCYDIESFVKSLKSRKIIILMVQSGDPVDLTIRSLESHLDKNDIIVDGGNSNFEDTIKRCEIYEKKFLFVGCGISGGEEGARFGPCMMPGGHNSAKEALMPIFGKISAKIVENCGEKESISSCTTWIGNDGSGHFVKIVHNGIEYADMQTICESYDFMRRFLGMKNEEISLVFDEWNKCEELTSYLIEITANIFKTKNEKNQFVIDKILDKAGQKGTGKWSVKSSLEEGVALNSISESVFQRIISSNLDLRQKIHAIYGCNREPQKIEIDEMIKRETIDALRDAVIASKIIAYEQGFALILRKSNQKNWNVDLSEIAKIFRGGCIIRSALLNHISNAYKNNESQLESLLLDNKYFSPLMMRIENNWRKTVALAVSNGMPMPVISSSLQYFDSIRSKRLPSNLLQAQRDYFGAHGYQEIGNDDKICHTNWTHYSGGVTSGIYGR